MSSDYDKNFMARKLLYESSFGVLSTFSQEIAGYPFGSLTPYSLDKNGEVIILISELAEHTKNIKANNHVSLTIIEKYEGNVQAFGRLTYIGDAQPIEESEHMAISRRHLRYFPEAEKSLQAHDFNFYRIHLKKARYIGGFGKIFWVQPKDLLIKSIFDYDKESSLLTQINQENGQIVLESFSTEKMIDFSGKSDIKIIGIDNQGLDVMVDKKKYRVYFSNIVENVSDAVYTLRKLGYTLSNYS